MGYHERPCSCLIEWRIEHPDGHDICTGCSRIFGGRELPDCPRCGMPYPGERCDCEDEPPPPVRGKKLNGANVWHFCNAHQNCRCVAPCPVCFERDHPGFDGCGLPLLVPCAAHRRD